MAIHEEYIDPIDEELLRQRAAPQEVFLEKAIQEEMMQEETVRLMPIREDFPEAGVALKGGESDGYEYKTSFAGSSLKHSYQMIRAFLEEEGYGEIPIPKDEQELMYFRLQTRNKQILLFEENGYVHNPIKIVFPTNRRNKRTLILCLYNESDPNHLLKFHRKI